MPTIDKFRPTYPLASSSWLCQNKRAIVTPQNSTFHDPRIAPCLIGYLRAQNLSVPGLIGCSHCSYFCSFFLFFFPLCLQSVSAGGRGLYANVTSTHPLTLIMLPPFFYLLIAWTFQPQRSLPNSCATSCYLKFTRTIPNERLSIFVIHII